MKQRWTAPAPLVLAALLGWAPGCRARPETPANANDLTAHVGDAHAASRAGWHQHRASPTPAPPTADAWAGTPRLHTFRAEPYATWAAQAAGEGIEPLLGGALAREALTRQSLMAAVYARSPRIEAAAQSIRARAQALDQVTQVEAVLAAFASFQRGSRGPVGAPLGAEMTMRHYPFPGSAELKARVVRAQIAEAQARYRTVVRDELLQASVLHARLTHVARAQATRRATLAALRHLEAAARAKVASGTGPKRAALSAQVEIAALEDRGLDLEQTERLIASDLARLLRLEPGTIVRVVPDDANGPERAPLEQPEMLIARAREQSPALALARARVTKLEAMIEMSERMAYPRADLGLSEHRGVSPATAGSDRRMEAFPKGPVLKLDPWLGGAAAHLAETRAQLARAQAQRDAADNDLAFAVRDAWTRTDSAHRRVTLDRDVLRPQSEEVYRDAAAAYAADRAPIGDVLDSARLWIRVARDMDAHVRELAVARAQLEAVMGEWVRLASNDVAQD